MKKITVVLILFALVLTACKSLGAKAEKDTPAAKATDVNSALLPVIVFQRSGGFAGVSEQWSIYESGKVVKLNGDEISIEPAQVKVLLNAIQAAGFYEMKATSGIGGLSNCKDCYTYKLTVNGDGKTNTITAQEGAKDIPEAFWNLIKQINSVLSAPTTQ